MRRRMGGQADFLRERTETPTHTTEPLGTLVFPLLSLVMVPCRQRSPTKTTWGLKGSGEMLGGIGVLIGVIVAIRWFDSESKIKKLFAYIISFWIAFYLMAQCSAVVGA